MHPVLKQYRETDAVSNLWFEFSDHGAFVPSSSMSSNERAERAATGVEIVSKAAAIIFALQGHGESTAQQLAEQVGEPVSSTYRLLTQLSTLGWVERGSQRGLYRLGLLLLRIGGLVEDRLDVRSAAIATLQSLLADTGSTSFLCVRRGDRAVCIERLEGGEVRSLAMRIGDSLPLHSGAAPMAILAFLPRGDQAAYLERLRQGEGAERVRWAQSQIELVRARGHSVSDGDVTPGIAAIGAPVRNHRGEIEASISISGLRHRILTEQTDSAGLVVAGALQASRALGFEETT